MPSIVGPVGILDFLLGTVVMLLARAVRVPFVAVWRMAWKGVKVEMGKLL